MSITGKFETDIRIHLFDCGFFHSASVHNGRAGDAGLGRGQCDFRRFDRITTKVTLRVDAIYPLDCVHFEDNRFLFRGVFDFAISIRSFRARMPLRTFSEIWLVD